MNTDYDKEQPVSLLIPFGIIYNIDLDNIPSGIDAGILLDWTHHRDDNGVHQHNTSYEYRFRTFEEVTRLYDPRYQVSIVNLTGGYFDRPHQQISNEERERLLVAHVSQHVLEQIEQDRNAMMPNKSIKSYNAYLRHLHEATQWIDNIIRFSERMETK